MTLTPSQLHRIVSEAKPDIEHLGDLAGSIRKYYPAVKGLDFAEATLELVRIVIEEENIVAGYYDSEQDMMVPFEPQLEAIETARKLIEQDMSTGLQLTYDWYYAVWFDQVWFQTQAKASVEELLRSTRHSKGLKGGWRRVMGRKWLR